MRVSKIVLSLPTYVVVLQYFLLKKITVKYSLLSRHNVSKFVTIKPSKTYLRQTYTFEINFAHYMYVNILKKNEISISVFQIKNLKCSLKI